MDYKLENQKVAEMYEQVTDWNITPQVSASGAGTVVMKMKLPYKESSVIMQMSEKDLESMMQSLAQCKQAIMTTKAQMAEQQALQAKAPADAPPKKRTVSKTFPVKQTKGQAVKKTVVKKKKK